MAVNKNTAAVLDETIEAAEAELSEKQIINEAIGRVVESLGIDVQKNRYKAMRAIAFQAFSNSIADGSFDTLVDEAIANVDSLPAGWEIERSEKAEPVKATPAKKAPVKAAVKAPVKAATKATATKAAPAAKAAPRRRPTR